MSASKDVSHLRHGLFLSVLFHAFVFLFFADILALTAASLPEAESEAAIQITLLQPRHEHLASTPEQQPAPRILTIPAHQKANFLKTQVPKVFPEKLSPRPFVLAPSTASAERSEAFEVSDSKVSMVPADQPPPNQPKPLSADDLRQYGLEIGRWAKRYKHYPLLARERGIEGTVMVVVSTRAGLAVPQVSLSKSSGAPLLDAQALETLGRAVRDAKMPDALRHRDFAIDLPLQFSLDD